MNDKLNYIDDVLHDGTDTNAMHYLTDTEEYIYKLERENQQLKERVKTLKDTQLKQLAIIQQRDEVIDEAIKLIKEKTRVMLFERNGEGRGFELVNYDVQQLLEILQKYKGDNNE